MYIQIQSQNDYFLVIKSIGVHPWKLLIFNYYIQFIYFKVEEKLSQDKSLIFKVKDSKFQKEMAEELFDQSKTNLFSTYTL